MRLSVLALLALLAGSASAQDIRATTDDGRTVLLRADGTWTFEITRLTQREDEIVVDLSAPPPGQGNAGPPPPPMPPRTLLGGDGAYQIRYDASRWSEAPNLIPGESEYGFKLPFGAGFAATIYEVMSIPIPTMREIVLSNARQGIGGNVTVVNEEHVKVPGGGKALRLEFRVISPEGLDVTMVNLMHSNEQGTLQVVTWTTTDLMERYRDELRRFQDGLSIPSAE